MKKSKKIQLGRKFNIFYFLLAFMGVIFLRDLWVINSGTSKISYNEFQSLLKEGKVKEVFIGENVIRGTLAEKDQKSNTNFVTNRVDFNLSKELDKYGIKYTQIIENTFFKSILSWVLPIFIFFALWSILMNKMASKGGLGGSFMSVGKSKAKVYVEDDTKITFNDVAGVDEAKEELKEIVNFLKDSKKYGRLGGRMPKGVLLVGPPGTGKTLMAKAVAGEAGVPFFSISGSEFVEMFVGVGAARVRDLFDQAKTKAPCIIFIDELDALGRTRSAISTGGHDEKEQTLNQLLVELDGFDSKSGIILLAATNRPEILDPALLRAGRFDRQVLIDRPDKKGRLDILKVHSKKVILEPNVNLEEVAGLTAGFTGADLANLVNEAALEATRRGGEGIGDEDFTKAIERIVAGLERRNRLLNPFEKKVVAYHEMGHALVAASLEGADPVHKVSIIPRGIGSLGYTIQRPTEDRYLMTQKELENKMGTLMGGRAAEKLIFDHLSTGASDDMDKATDIARNMVMKYGMDESLGNITYEKHTNTYLGQNMVLEKNYSEQTSREIDLAVKKIIQQAYNSAFETLLKNKATLIESAETLLKNETLDRTELAPFFQKVRSSS